MIPNEKENAPGSLVRALGLRDSLAIVAGSMIGTGIFLKTAPMTQELGSPFWVMAAWVIAGLLSLLGAMSYAELGGLFPRAGGGYVYIREAYGRLAGFLTGWVSFWIIFPGSIAAYAVASATFMGGLLPTAQSRLLVSLLLIAVFAALNSLQIAFGGFLQSLLTAVKVLAIVGLAAALFAFSPEGSLTGALTPASAAFGWGAFGMATLSALWAYDGWEALSRVAGEVRDPRRNIPLALILGIGLVFGLYALLNLAFFYALPLGEILTANSAAHPEAQPVATKAAVGFLGDSGARLLSLMFVVSTLGAMNGCVMTSARVPFAMAQDGLFLSFLSKVSPRTRVPVRAIWIQALVAGALAATGTFDQLTNYVVFSAWFFYGLTGATIFVFRRRFPPKPGAFRAPPGVPSLFVAMAAVLVVTTLIQSPVESAIGLALILTGVPVYLWAYCGKKAT